MKVGTGWEGPFPITNVSQLEKISVTNSLNTHFKAVKDYECSDMRPNLSRVGRDFCQLGQCPNFHRLLVFKASLISQQLLTHTVYQQQYNILI